jgi:basic membrane protein A
MLPKMNGRAVLIAVVAFALSGTLAAVLQQPIEPRWGTTWRVIAPENLDGAEGQVAVLLEPPPALYNEAATAGAEAAARDLGYEITVVESVSSTDIIDILHELAVTGEYDLIVGIGYLFALSSAVEEFVDQEFAWIEPLIAPGESADLPNVTHITFRENEMAALVGALAGLAAAHHGYEAAGLILGYDPLGPWNAEAGFRFGVNWANERSGDETELRYAYTAGGFPDSSRDAAARMLNQSTVGIYGGGGTAGFGALDAVCKAHGHAGTSDGPPYVFGGGTNWDMYMDGRCVLASAIKRVDQAVYWAIESVRDGTFAGGVVRLGIADGGVGLSSRSDLEASMAVAVAREDLEENMRETILGNWEANRATIPDWIWVSIENLTSDIASGAIAVPTAPTEEELEEVRQSYPLGVP